MEYSIRTAREADAASIVELLNPLIAAGTYTIMDRQLSVEDQIDFMRGFPKRGIFNVAICDQRIVGLQSVEPGSGAAHAFQHVGDISTFVARDSHGRGIGRRLSQVTFQEAKEQGFLKLCATVRADNPRAVAFYLSQGFSIIGTARRHALVHGKYLDEILMEQLLAEELER